MISFRPQMQSRFWANMRKNVQEIILILPMAFNEENDCKSTRRLQDAQGLIILIINISYIYKLYL